MPKRKATEISTSSSTTSLEPFAASSTASRSTGVTHSRIPKPVQIIEPTNKLSTSSFSARHLTDSLLTYNPTPRATPTSTEPQAPPEEEFEITLKYAEHLHYFELKACFHLIELTSRDAYEESAWGWKPVNKIKEMRDKDMRYLLVRQKENPTAVESSTRENGLAHGAEIEKDGEGQGEQAPEQDAEQEDTGPGREERNPPAGDPSILGFLSFMLTYEDGFEVIYIYEIHLLPVLRSLGLGRHLLNVVEHVGKSVGVQKSMLTCFRSNKEAWRWYEKRGYEEDENSPAEKRFRNGKVKRVDYLILSKRLNSTNSSWTDND
ncbi:N alpha-acetyl-transferase [Zalaria obscura]|uniref:N alpha-acetyl-transferase n=1 Tax=Zalaria obscura TaxID=2024903 RepID=A0ACC3S506_9PEZI